jgi:hypothetical protein
VTRTALAELDTALSDLSAALEATADDERASTLLSDARALQDRLDDALASTVTDESEGGPATDAMTRTADVDVDAELDSIKDDLDTDGDGPEDTPSGADSPAE